MATHAASMTRSCGPTALEYRCLYSKWLQTEREEGEPLALEIGSETRFPYHVAISNTHQVLIT